MWRSWTLWRPGAHGRPRSLVPNATLAPGGSFNYACTLANVTADFTNSATATGTPPVGPDVTATDTAAVDVIASGDQCREGGG